MRKLVGGLFVIAALIGIFYFGGFFQTESKKEKHTIGVISYSPAGVPALAGLREGLKDHGFEESRNLLFLDFGVVRDKGKLQAEAHRLVAEKPDLIYTIATPATLAVKEATRESGIPVVFGPVSSPVGTGIVADLSRPGGNITGVTFGPQEPRRLEMLRKILPAVKTIFVPYNPNDKSPRQGITRLGPPAAKLGIRMILAEARNREELVAALHDFPAEADAIFVPTDALLVSLSPLLVEFANRRKIPLTTPQREGVAAGALYSYGFSIADVGRQAARLVVQILKGTQPRNLPVELSEFILAVNLATAETIGVDIPDELLRHAVIFRE